jgi:tetratricopeptide (TPR) repeat protein
MGKFEWSNRAFELGLEGLAPRDHRNRATALCGLFHNLLELDQIHEALPYLRTAEALPLDPRNRAKMMWMNGLALSKSNLHEEALAYLEAAVGQLEQVAPIDGALAAIDLIHTLLLTGKPAHAHRKAREMISFMIPLSEKKAAQAALIELSNLGLRGVGLTLDLLERVRSEITPLAEFNTL